MRDAKRSAAGPRISSARENSGIGAESHGLDLHVAVGGSGLRAGLERDLRRAVRLGRLKPGTRLPSSRDLAADLGIARNTVANAYTQLVAEGWLDAERGRGTVVARDLPEATLLSEPIDERPRPPYDPYPGVPDIGQFPRDPWTAAYRRALMAAPPDAFDYGDPLGHRRLRATLAAYLGRARGVRTTGSNIVICNGATHGLSMLATVLGRSRDASMAMESLCFPTYRRVASQHGLTVAPIPVDGEGARVDRLWSASATAVVLTPAHQFPTGVPLSPDRRAGALEWARNTGGVVVEDDYDGEFRYDRTRIGALQADDPDHVVYLGSLSKILAPGLRIGWMAVPDRLLDPLAQVRRTSDLHPGVGEQLCLAEYIECGDLDRHVRAARLRYRRRRELLQRALASRPRPLRLRGASAGLHGLIELPGGRPAELETLARAAARGLAVAGLSTFRIGPDDGADQGGIVVGYARAPRPRVPRRAHRAPRIAPRVGVGHPADPALV